VSPRALVINTAFIGDVVFTLPLVENLGLAGYAVDLVARPGFGALAAGLPGFDTAFAFDKRGRDAGTAALVRLGRTLRARRYDLVLGAHPSVRSGLLAALVRGGTSVGWGAVGYGRRVRRGPRFVEDALALAEAAGVPIEVRAPRHRTSPDPVVPAGAVALVPGSRRATKRWPHWAALAARVRAAGRPVVVFGSEGERPLAAGVGADLDTLGWPLPRAAAALAACDVAVGGDSGLLHLARAVDTPVVMLFGPTAASRLPPDAGRLDLAVPGLSCRPCSDRGPRRCPLGHHRCLADLSPDTVLGSLQRHARSP
jgi:heptosyltransferase-2